MASYITEIRLMGAKELADELRKVQRATPDIYMRHVRLAGTRFKKDVIDKTRSAIKKERTGNLCKGYRRVVRLEGNHYGSYCADVYGGAGKAHHYHLVENGHRKFNRAGTRPIGFTKGRFMMKKTIEEWENGDKLDRYSRAAVREAFRKGAIDL